LGKQTLRSYNEVSGEGKMLCNVNSLVKIVNTSYARLHKIDGSTVTSGLLDDFIFGNGFTYAKGVQHFLRSWTQGLNGRKLLKKIHIDITIIRPKIYFCWHGNYIH